MKYLLLAILFFTLNSEARLLSKLELKKDKLGNVLIFISKDCPCSKGNLDYINKLASEFNDYQFIAIHSKKNASDALVESYLQDKKLNFDVINDSDLKLADTYHALKTPHAFILRGQEIVYNGGITNTTMPENAKEAFLKDALMDIRKSGVPHKKETRTLGCFIAR